MAALTSSSGLKKNRQALSCKKVRLGRSFFWSSGLKGEGGKERDFTIKFQVAGAGAKVGGVQLEWQIRRQACHPTFQRCFLVKETTATVLARAGFAINRGETAKRAHIEGGNGTSQDPGGRVEGREGRVHGPPLKAAPPVEERKKTEALYERAHQGEEKAVRGNLQ